MAARSVWTGSINFGLVNIPVKLFPAVREDDIHFHLLHDQDGSRLQRKLVCAADGKEVHPEHTVRGYEVGPDQYVIVSQEELDAITPRKSRSIEIRDFVDASTIDPMYYDQPYYVVPQEQGTKAYRLLVDAMARAKRIGIAQFVLRNKEHLAALRPVEGGALVLETMHFNDEVTPPNKVEGVPVHTKADDRELKMAQQLIDSLATDFKPQRYRDEYKQAVRELVDRKAKGEEVVTPPPSAEKPARTTDLLSALEASLAKAKGDMREVPGQRREGSGGARKRRKS